MITSFFKPKKADSSVKNIKSEQSDEESIPVEKKMKDSKFPAGITLVKKVRLHNEIEIAFLFFKHPVIFAHCQYLVLLLIDPTIHMNNISFLQKLRPPNKLYLPNLLVCRKGKKGRAMM